MFSTNQRIKRLQAAIDRDGYNQGAHFQLGQEYMHEGRFMQGAAKFRKVVELNPDHAVAWMMMGRCYDSAGVAKEAAIAYDTSAYAFDKMGRPEDAAAMREAAENARKTAALGMLPFREQF